MTRSTKLILSFLAVILFMVAGTIAYVFYSQTTEAQSIAAHKVSNALSKLNADFVKIQTGNRDLANKLSRDQSVLEALSAQDRTSLSNSLKTAADARGFSGFITVIDQYGKVIFSSDTPGKFSYGMRGKCPGLDYVLNNVDAFAGITTSLTAAQSIALTAMVPATNPDGKCIGVIAVSDPIDEQFLTGESMKFALLNDPLTNIDFVLLNLKDRNHIYVTPNLLQEKPDFLRQLSEQGAKALPSGGFAKDRRYWQQLSLNALAPRPLSMRSFAPENSGNNLEVVGIILGTTTVRPQGVQPGFMMLASCIIGLIAFIIACLLSRRLAGQSDSSVQVLIDRIKTWRNEAFVSPAKGLSGAWQELSDLIDQTLLDWQGKANTLKVQLNKLAEQMSEKTEEAQTSDDQFASLNRQLANQNRQLSEFSRQLNHANQQAVFLQHELQAILQSTTEGFLVLDQYGNVISANTIFLNWLGMSEAEIAGRFCFDLIKKPGDANTNGGPGEAGRAFVKHDSDSAALINQFFPEGVIYNAQSAQAIEILLHLQPVAAQDSNIQGYVLVARDKSLRSEIAGLRVEIVNMLARAVRGPLMAAEKEWQDVLSAKEKWNEQELEKADANAVQAEGTAEHGQEIHQQLNRELNQELAPQAAPGLAQRLEALRAHYQNLIKSVESLLNTHGESIGDLTSSPAEDGSLSDSERGPSPGEAAKESFSVSRLVGDCLEEVSSLARERQLLLDHKTSTALPTLAGDRELMKGILTPVVEKMISITAAGGRVRVESSIKNATKGKELQLSVSSSGPALSEEEMADMFAGFIPEKHSEDSYGTRLALYLARNNAERVGAHIWAQSEAGRGTLVYITLPLG